MYLGISKTFGGVDPEEIQNLIMKTQKHSQPSRNTLGRNEYSCLYALKECPV